MKPLNYFMLCLLAGAVCVACSDKDEKDDPAKVSYPITTVVDEGAYTGTITTLPNPPDGSDPILPGTVLGLETTSGKYILKIDGRWCPDRTFTFDATTFTVGEKVRITGTLTRTQVSATEEYMELAIIDIERPTGPDPVPDHYPVTTVIGEGTYAGTITTLPNPPDGSDPIVPGTVLGLKTEAGEFILRYEERWIADESVEIGSVVYTAGDAVEITGRLTETQVSAKDAYKELTVETIAKRG